MRFAALPALVVLAYVVRLVGVGETEVKRNHARAFVGSLVDIAARFAAIRLQRYIGGVSGLGFVVDDRHVGIGFYMPDAAAIPVK